MKQFNTVKGFMLGAALIAGAGTASGQAARTSHPHAFENTPGTTTFYNYYKDYVGMRLQVTAPDAIAGDYAFTTSNDGSGSTAVWGGYVSTPIVNVPIYMGTGVPGDDSFGCAPFTAGSYLDMPGKIAVIWRQDCEFGAKALNAQNNGAIAVVLINQFENEGPVGMAAGAVGASVTIPVFMVGNQEGKRIAGQYRALPMGSVKMTITPWGKGLPNDLGFVPGGAAMWHNSAIPFYQLNGSTSAGAYKMTDGAFIANYGTSDANGVGLRTTLNFTAEGSTTSSMIHTDTLTVTPGSTTLFPVTDSIYTVFSPDYELTGITGEGRVDINYKIGSATADAFPFDNNYTHSFFLTDSIFSKGRYDFANNHPVATLWTSTTPPYLWGVPYFVAKGGDALKQVEFSVSTGPGVITASTMDIYVFKWVDGGTSGFLDSIIVSGELELVGSGQYSFDGSLDSSFQFFKATITDDTTLGTGGMVKLTDNSWYLVVANPQSTTTTGVALGCDGIISAYSRSYGRRHFNNFTELYNPVAGADLPTFRGASNNAFASWAFGGAPFDVDSTAYATQNGLIPSLAFRVGKWFPVGVSEVAGSKSAVNVFPNPTNNELNIALNLENRAKKVTFTVLNSAAQVVASETKTDLQNEQVSISTSKFAAGNYFVVISVDGKTMHKKFTVVH